MKLIISKPFQVRKKIRTKHYIQLRQGVKLRDLTQSEDIDLAGSGAQQALVGAAGDPRDRGFPFADAWRS